MLFTISFGNLKSGIPYTNSPPNLSYLSYIVTSIPSFARNAAHVSPAGPPPIIATFLLLVLILFSINLFSNSL